MLFSSNQDAFEDESLGSLIPLLVALLAIVVCNVWSIFTTSHALAEVQGFKSAWKGLLNVVLAFLVVLIPFILLAITVLVAGKL